MINEQKLMSAFKELRAATGLSQPNFGPLIGKSMGTVQNYETRFAPPAAELAKFVYLAREYGRPDLAQIFKEAAIQSIPVEIVQLISEGDDAPTHNPPPRKTRKA